MKTKRFAFAIKHNNWLKKQWGNAMFFLTNPHSNSLSALCQKEKYMFKKYTIQSMENRPS